MIMKGDVSQNYRVDVDDLFLIKMHLLEVITLTGPALVAADINNDGEISGTDMARLQMHRLGVRMITEVVDE